jgi:hypothetical protein
MAAFPHFWSKLKERCAFWLLARVDPYVARRQMQRLESMYPKPKTASEPQINDHERG